MKKLRMIVTSVIVLAIVGGAFAFNANKVGVFCVDTFPFNTNFTCEGILSGRYIVTPPAGIRFRYYSNWNGKASTCVGQPNCTTELNLSDLD